MKRWMASVLAAGILAAGCAPGRGGISTETVTQATATATKRVRPSKTPRPTQTPTPILTATAIPVFSTPLALQDAQLPMPVEAISAGNAGEVVQLARLGKGRVTDVTYSPDGRLLGVVTYAGIYIYDAQSNATLQVIEATRVIEKATFSPDGLRVAGLFADGTIQVWRVSDGAQLEAYSGLGATFDPSGNLLIVQRQQEKRAIQIWDAGSRKIVSALQLNVHWGAADINTVFVDFSSDGTRVAMETTKRGAGVWDVNSGKMLMTGTCGGYLSSGALSEDGTMLATGCDEFGKLAIWRVNDRELLHNLDARNFPSEVQNIVFSPDGHTLAAGWEGGIVELWATGDGNLLRGMGARGYHVTNIAFSRDGTQLVGGYSNGRVRRWQLADRTIREDLHDMAPQEGVEFSPDDRLLVSGTAYGIQLWDLQKGSLYKDLQTNRGMHPVRGKLLSLAYRSGLMAAVVDIDLSPNGNIAAAIYENGDLFLWRLPSGRLFYEANIVREQIYEIGFFPDGQRLAIFSLDVWTFDLVSGHVSKVREQEANTHAFSHDGKFIALGNMGYSTILSVADNFKRVKRLYISSPGSMEFSPDGKSIAVGGRDTIKIFDVDEGKLVRKFVGPEECMGAATFSPDGLLLASGSSEGVVCLWRVADGHLLKQLYGHVGGVWDISFSHDGRLLATAGYDGAVRLWGVAP